MVEMYLNFYKDERDIEDGGILKIDIEEMRKNY